MKVNINEERDLEIYNLYKNKKVKQKDIAKQYGLTLSKVSQICVRQKSIEVWNEIISNGKLTQEEKDKILLNEIIYADNSRIGNAIIRYGIKNITELLELFNDMHRLFRIRNLGKESIEVLARRLIICGYKIDLDLILATTIYNTGSKEILEKDNNGFYTWRSCHSINGNTRDKKITYIKNLHKSFNLLVNQFPSKFIDFLIKLKIKNKKGLEQIYNNNKIICKEMSMKNEDIIYRKNITPEFIGYIEDIIKK